jgi:hypothetical protein
MLAILNMSDKTKGKKIKNCWEFVECPIDFRKKCDAYKKNIGNACWFVANEAGTECFSYKRYGGCKNCPWYKAQNK